MNNELVCAADIHYSEEKFNQIEYSFNFFLEYIKKKRPDFVVLAGDYFEKRLSPDSKVYKHAIGNLIEISKYTNYLIVIKGTHSHDANQLEILRELKKVKNNIYYYDTFTIDTFKIKDGHGTEKNIKFAFIPEEYPKNHKEYYKRLYEENFDFIIGHGMLNGAKLHNGVVNKYIKDLRFNYTELDKHCKYNIWGHIHLPQQLSEKTFYVGSLGRWQFGEEEPKRFLSINIDIHTDNWNIKSIETPTYEYLTFTYSEYLELRENIEELLSDEKVYIRIFADKDIEELKKLKEKFKDRIKIEQKNKEINIQNEIKYEEVLNKTPEEQYLYVLNEELKTKKFTKKERKLLEKDKILPLIKEMIENTKLCSQ